MKSIKKSLFLFGFLAVLLLSGCAPSSAQNDGNLFNQILVDPFTKAIHGLAGLFNGNFGLAIIFITLIIRLILLPLMLRQYKSQQAMKEKMDNLKPELDELQARIKQTKDQTEQQKLQKEMMGLYQKHGVNPLAMGCLPILIQMPILMGLYYAIRGSKEIASHTFLWFNLGHSDLWITLIAGVVYYLQFKVSQSTLPTAQQQQMKMMGLLSPIMIVMFSFNAPAALPLYWAIGGTFLILQTILSRKIYSKPSKGKLQTEK
jgi:YidC/Oxa1 family membrane protein insertase